MLLGGGWGEAACFLVDGVCVVLACDEVGARGGVYGDGDLLHGGVSL